ncbi:hypothetical protein [Nakamurella lactea]|uniref:hypothetical protein n=1 Tax=Nakamurella lactea TaxID=459515 RepID=UPI001B7F9698|nr:hypothetical protein [Nakamurella lactea]
MRMNTRTTTETDTATPTGRLSPASLTLCAVLLIVGVGAGAITFAGRSDVREAVRPGTSAWPVHLVLAVVGLGWLTAAMLRRRRTAGAGLFLLAPLGRAAAQRLRLTLRQAPWRLLVGLPALALLLFTPVRVGEQLIAGLDPNFVSNAWGGPTYLGAMACHYLDSALIAATCVVLLDLLLKRPAAATRPV